MTASAARDHATAQPSHLRIARKSGLVAHDVTIVGGGRAGATIALLLAGFGRDTDPDQPAQAAVDSASDAVSDSPFESPMVHVICRGASRRLKFAPWSVGLPLTVIASPSRAALCAPLVIFATADRDLRAAAEAWQAARAGHDAAAQVWLHLSGAAPPAVLRIKGCATAVGSCHPLAAIPDPLDGDASAPVALVGRPLRGAFFALAGDPDAVAQGRVVACALGGDPHPVPVARRAAYHGAAAVVANDLVGLLAIGERLCGDAGLPPAAARPALIHLARTALDAVAAAALRPGGQLADGLTGAVGRGDADTLSGHLEALAAAPDSAEAHRRLSRVLLKLVVAAGGLDGPQAAAVAEAVGSPTPKANRPASAQTSGSSA